MSFLSNPEAVQGCQDPFYLSGFPFLSPPKVQLHLSIHMLHWTLVRVKQTTNSYLVLWYIDPLSKPP